MQPDEQQTSLKPHAKVIAVGIICVALVATTFVYAQKNTLFGSSTGQTGANGTDVASTSSEENSVNPLASLQVQNATGTVTIVSPDILTPVGSSGATSSDDTLTAKVSQDLFARLMADQQNGVTIDDTEANNIANQTILDNAPTSGATQYSISDLKITSDTSNTERVAYNSAIQTALNRDRVIITNQSVLNIMTNYTGNQDPTNTDVTPNVAALAQLTPVIAAYQDLITQTLKITVPQDNVGNQIVYLNSLSNILYDIRNMSQINTDPVLAYIGISSYQTDLIGLEAAITDLNTYFDQQ